MKKISLIASALTCLMAFTACDNNADLYGDDLQSGKSGQLSLQLVNNAKVNEISRADNEANDKGEKPGVFDPAEVNVQNYELKVTDSNDKDVLTGTVAGLGGNNGTVTKTLAQGAYTVTAQNYDGSQVTVSTRPWFQGQTTGTVEPGKTTSMKVTCKLQNLQVKVALSQGFIDDFQDDYTITVDNGDGAIQTFTKDNVNSVYFFAVPANKTSISVNVKATVKSTGKAIIKNYTVTKPEDATGDRTLKAGDAFILNLTSDTSMLSHIDFGMSVDFSFSEQEFTFELDETEITFDESKDPGQGGGEDPNPDDNPGGIEMGGLPKEYTNPQGSSVTVDFTVPNGFKNLNVTIRTNNAGFAAIIDGMDMAETFDLCNPAAYKKDGTPRDLTETLKTLGLLPAEGELTGETAFTFVVTDFMPMLADESLGNGDYWFDIEVVDAKGNSRKGTLTVLIRL